MIHIINFNNIPISKKLKKELFNLSIINDLGLNGDVSKNANRVRAMTLFLYALEYYKNQVLNNYDNLIELGNYLNYFYETNLNFSHTITLFIKHNEE